MKLMNKRTPKEGISNPYNMLHNFSDRKAHQGLRQFNEWHEEERLPHCSKSVWRITCVRRSLRGPHTPAQALCHAAGLMGGTIDEGVPRPRPTSMSLRPQAAMAAYVVLRRMAVEVGAHCIDGAFFQ